MHQQFDIKLKTVNHFSSETQDPSVGKIRPVLESMDPYVLNSVHQACQSSKSAALALALVYKDGTEEGLSKITLEDCINIARLDERHQ